MLLNKKKLTILAILGAMILFLIGMRIFNEFLPKTEEELAQEQVVDNQIIPNSVLIVSDGSINEDVTPLKKQTLRYLFECDQYKYAEMIINEGFLSAQINSMLNYKEGFSSYEYVIISGGFCDFLLQLDIGDFNDTPGLCKIACDFFDICAKQSPNTKYILVGVPYFEDIKMASEIKEIKYTVADYNLALKLIADKYDNVYLLDFAEKTYETPANVSNNEYLYDANTLQLLYESFNRLKENIN